MKSSILIVDDDPEVREMLCAALDPHYNILEADNGMSGLSEVLLSEQHIDLIITDLRMPRKDGIEFVEELPTAIPFLVISGFINDTEFAERLKKLNPAAVLEKPFRLAALKETVSSCLNSSSSDPNTGARILVIEDEEPIRKVLQKMLEKEGYEVLEAENGEAGLKLFRENPTEVVITDMLMPVKSGLEVIQELRRDFPEVKIIGISAFGIREEPDMVSLAERYGAIVAFEKPFSQEQILGAVRSLLED